MCFLDELNYNFLKNLTFIQAQLHFFHNLPSCASCASRCLMCLKSDVRIASERVGAAPGCAVAAVTEAEG